MAFLLSVATSLFSYSMDRCILLSEYISQKQNFLQPVSILIARLYYAPAFMITLFCILPKCNSWLYSMYQPA